MRFEKTCFKRWKNHRGILFFPVLGVINSAIPERCVIWSAQLFIESGNVWARLKYVREIDELLHLSKPWRNSNFVKWDPNQLNQPKLSAHTCDAQLSELQTKNIVDYHLSLLNTNASRWNEDGYHPLHIYYAVLMHHRKKFCHRRNICSASSLFV